MQQNPGIAPTPPSRGDFLADGFLVLGQAVSAARADVLIEGFAALGAGYGRRNLLRACPEVAALAVELKPLAARWLGPSAFPVRGLFFDKLPDANWEVGWHQDLSIAVRERFELSGFTGWSIKQGVLHVQPPAEILENMVTLRVHLDDCAMDNGPLRVLRGSHREGRLNDETIAHWKDTGEEVTCAVAKGDALLLRPLLLHASSRATRPSHRRVVHIEYAASPLPPGLHWHEGTT